MGEVENAINRSSLEPHIKRARSYLSAQLARKPRTIWETERLLKRKDFSQPVIEAAIKDAIERRWLDDAAYAKLWIEHRSTTNPRGKMMLRRELRAKGITAEIIDNALAETDQSEESLIHQVIERKMLQLQHQDQAIRERKLIGFLKRRGFSYDAIRKALEEVEL